jgi:hypothetical protein
MRRWRLKLPEPRPDAVLSIGRITSQITETYRDAERLHHILFRGKKWTIMGVLLRERGSGCRAGSSATRPRATLRADDAP